jgi:glucokinase
MTDSKQLFAGLDIGGTTIKSILVNDKGAEVGDIVEVRSHVKDGYEATFAQLELAMDQLAEASGLSRGLIKGIGLDVPAPCSDGVIWGQANLAADWVGTNIRDQFSSRVNTPVTMTNDCNAAAVGEYAIRRKHIGGLLLVAPGTGLGGGMVLPGGRSFEGQHGLALEVGHVSVPFFEEDQTLPLCSCGLRGCAEAWVSLVALRRRLGIELAKEKWANHPLAIDTASIEEKAFRLRDFASQGDALACQLFEQQANILGHMIADVVRVFDPGLVVIGGGLAEAEDDFRDSYLDWVRDGFNKRAWPMFRHSPIDPEVETTRFEWASGGDGAAAFGMAFTAREMFR